MKEHQPKGVVLDLKLLALLPAPQQPEVVLPDTLRTLANR
jgi:hypothetical protein